MYYDPRDFSPVPSWRRAFRFWVRAMCWISLLTGLILGLYLTLRRSGNFRDLWWMPAAVQQWTSGNGRLRNLPAFAALAVPVMILANGRRARRNAIAGLAAFAAITELAQHFIPTRRCEWQDIACGWAGLLLTWTACELFFFVAWRLRGFWRQAMADDPRGTPDSAASFPPVLTRPPAKYNDRP